MINIKFSASALIISLAAAAAFPALCRADEGMFPFNTPPQKQLAQKYNFTLSEQWLDKAMHAAVRFNNGGSGGFISADGLVITNHHIADETLSELSTPTRDLIANGFLAKNRSEELKAPNLEINCLQSITDVTDRVNSSITPQTDAAQADSIRKANIATIEKEAGERTKLRCDVVTLYQGGQYCLYIYKKYTDIRLVWAPEQEAAFFGGDADNFEYPRTCLDAAIFRVYENGKPVKPQHFFTINPQGPQENDLVFVVGHPGTTNRLETYAQTKHTRSVTLPYRLARARAMEAAYLQFAERSPENARRINNDIRSIANSRKAYTGMYQGLCRTSIMERKKAQEDRLRKLVSDQTPWQDIEKACRDISHLEEPYYLLEKKDAYPSPLFSIARHIVRLAREKDNPQFHLQEYNSTKLDSLKQNIFSPAPIYADVEKARLSASFSFAAERLGADNPSIQIILQGQSPADRAAELVDGCHLFDVKERERLANLSWQELQKTDDSMIQLALSIDDNSRQLRRAYENIFKAPSVKAYAQIATERFKIDQGAVPPDATFTLRLSYGVVKGYQDNGQEIKWCTTLDDLYKRAELHKGTPPFRVPPSWLNNRDSLDLHTHMVFTATSDTIGGNSGSPVLNKAGELVGLNFDRNQFGMVRNFVYDEVKARHISVASPALLEALRHVYHADSLVKEITASSSEP
ncbi:MAG: S46 family peptidase [Candidatus Bruticola sp.]